MLRNALTLLSLLLAAGLLAPAWAQEDGAAIPAVNYEEEIPLGAEIAICPSPVQPAPPPLAPTVQWRQMCLCRSFGPAEVQGFRVRCSGATFLDFHVSDCCIPGDHQQLKGKNWDTAPNTAVTTAPGGVVAWSVAGRTYNYGGTPFNPGNIDTYVECTYPHGVDVFPFDAFVHFSSDGLCTITPDPPRQRIDRTP